MEDRQRFRHRYNPGFELVRGAEKKIPVIVRKRGIKLYRVEKGRGHEPGRGLQKRISF